jgi:hypothetical protein
MCDVKVCKFPEKGCYYEHIVQHVKGSSYDFAKKEKARLDDLDIKCEKRKTQEISIESPNGKA